MTNKQIFILALVGLIVIGVVTALMIAEGRSQDVVNGAKAMGFTVVILAASFGLAWLSTR